MFHLEKWSDFSFLHHHRQLLPSLWKLLKRRRRKRRKKKRTQQFPALSNFRPSSSVPCCYCWYAIHSSSFATDDDASSGMDCFLLLLILLELRSSEYPSLVMSNVRSKKKLLLELHILQGISGTWSSEYFQKKVVTTKSWQICC